MSAHHPRWGTSTGPAEILTWDVKVQTHPGCEPLVIRRSEVDFDGDTLVMQVKSDKHSASLHVTDKGRPWLKGANIQCADQWCAMKRAAQLWIDWQGGFDDS